MIAQLCINDKPASSDWIVGAFCGEECRGIAKQVEGLQFLSIHGSIADGETIGFMAYNTVTGVMLSVEDQIEFKGQRLGLFNDPVSLRATDSGVTDINPTLNATRNSNLAPRYFSLDGRRVEAGLTPGVVVVIEADGSTKKVLQK
jgi:hypothetical protein